MKKQSEFPFGAVGHHIHAAHANTAPNGKLKRGVKCFCGRIFWAVAYTKKEIWLSPESFSKHNQKAKKRAAEWQAKNREKARESSARWRTRNPGKVIARNKKYYAENKEAERARVRKKYKENAVKYRQYNKLWRIKNIGYEAKRLKEDARFRISRSLRARVRAAIKRNAKFGNTQDLVGCSFEFLRFWLESKFKPGMSWENYGAKGWHVDHIRPLASFDLTDAAQQRLACHFINLQPLWASENLSKAASY